MVDTIIDPFKKNKKTDWAKKANERLSSAKEGKVENINRNQEDKKKVERVAKSFKIFPGKISRDFDKRVNKMQVNFDDLDFDKNYVDSGKYLMFLMCFAEKYGLYELYNSVDTDGNFDLDKKKFEKYIIDLKKLM